jgi:hypothetical protein
VAEKCGCYVIEDRESETRSTYEIVYCPIHAAAERMVAMLAALQWSGPYGNCPCCQWDRKGHAPNCDVASTIAASEGR